MNYIYGYYNKITNKWYVGQTTMPIKERHKLHLSGANSKKASDYNCLFHKKIREYGINNFDLVVLEEVPNKENLDEREQYWIKEKNSFVRNNGYNLTTGGQFRKDNEDYWDIRCSLNKEQALEIIDLLQHTNTSQIDISKKYKVNASIINQINAGTKYRLLNDESYPIRKTNRKTVNEETIQAIIGLLKMGYGNTEIVEILDNKFTANTVSSINRGTKHHKADIEYPIREKTNANKIRQEKSQIIKLLLEEGKLNNKEIAEQVKCDPSTVSRINFGETYRDDNREYPIRK